MVFDLLFSFEFCKWGLGYWVLEPKTKACYFLLNFVHSQRRCAEVC